MNIIAVILIVLVIIVIWRNSSKPKAAPKHTIIDLLKSFDFELMINDKPAVLKFSNINTEAKTFDFELAPSLALFKGLAYSNTDTSFKFNLDKDPSGIPQELELTVNDLQNAIELVILNKKTAAAQRGFINPVKKQ